MDPFTWFYIFAVVFLAVGFLVKTKPTDAAKAALADFTFPRSNQGDPVGLVYGTVKILSPNVLWTGAFQGKAITKKVSTGLFSSKRVTVSYDYYIGMDLGLCLGPNVRVREIAFGKYVAWSGLLTGGGSQVINNLELFGGASRNGGVIGTVYFYDGDVPQTQDPFLAYHIGAGAPRYNGLAHLVFTENNVSNRGFYWGKSPNIEPVSVEVDCFNNTLGIPGGKHIAPNGFDANPAEILYNLLTHEYARLGIDVARIDVPSFLAAADTLWDEGHGMSLQISSAARGTELIPEILKQVNGTVYQDPVTGKFVFGLQRQDYDKYTIPEITVDNLSEVSNYTRNLWTDTVNQVRVMFKNREDNYQDRTPAMWQDAGNIAQTGKVRSSQVSHPGCYDPDLAIFLATRTGAALSVPLFSADIKVNRAVGQTLRPNSVFRLTCRRLGIKKMIMRVREVDLGELEDGKVTVSGFQDIYASNQVTIGAPVPSAWAGGTPEPDAITAYKVIGAPYYFVKQNPTPLVGLLDSTGLIWALAVPPDGSSVGMSGYTSPNFATPPVFGISNRTQILDNVQYVRGGKVQVAYASTVADDDGFDSGGTGLVVYDLDPGALSDGWTPTTSTDSDIQTLGTNLMLVGNEIMAYRTATALGGGAYRLTNIRRALFDTTFESHAVDDRVFFLTSGDGMSDGAVSASFNDKVRLTDITTRGQYSVDSAVDISFSMDSRTYRPSPPSHITIGGVRQPATVANSTSPVIDFNERNRLTDNVKFFDDADSTPEAGTTYRLRWRVNGGAYTTVNPFTPGSTITLGPTLGLLEVEVWASRGGLESRVSTLGSSTVV